MNNEFDGIKIYIYFARLFHQNRMNRTIKNCKPVLWFIGSMLFFFSCSTHNSKDEKHILLTTVNKEDAPFMYFKEDFHDFGKITQGEKVSYIFTLENRGKNDLVLNYVNASCGCTVAKWDEKPIPYHKSTNIEVIFNSEGKIGSQTKTVSIKSNAIPDSKTLTLRCEVISPNNNSKTE